MKSTNNETYWLVWGKDIEPKNTSLVKCETRKQAIQIASYMNYIDYTLASDDIYKDFSDKSSDYIWLCYNKKKDDNHIYNHINIYSGSKKQVIQNYSTYCEIKPKNIMAINIEVYTSSDMNNFDSDEVSIDNHIVALKLPLMDVTNIKQQSIYDLLSEVKCYGKYLVYKHTSGNNGIDNDCNILYVNDYKDLYKRIVKDVSIFDNIEDCCEQCGYQYDQNESGCIFSSYLVRFGFSQKNTSITYNIFHIHSDDLFELEKLIKKLIRKKGYSFSRSESSEEQPKKLTKSKFVNKRKKIIHKSSESDSSE